MNSPLTYSDKVPTVPGWYWRRNCQGVRVVHVPYPYMVTHWEAWRESVIAPYPEDAKAKARANVKGWLVEYAGPIPEPR